MRELGEQLNILILKKEKAVFKFEMGAKVKDQITGFEGIVVACADYMTGCRQYCIQPKVKKGGKEYPKAYWLDEDRLHDGKPKNNGGPQSFSAPTK